MKTKKKIPKPRNQYAIDAWKRPGGPMKQKPARGSGKGGKPFRHPKHKKAWENTSSLERGPVSFSRPVLDPQTGGRPIFTNPWDEKYVGQYSPCLKCGGEGKIDTFSHVERGICFRCHGSGVQEKDWRSNLEPERFEILGKKVRVYPVRELEKHGHHKVLIREEDFEKAGTPGLYQYRASSGRPQRLGDRTYWTSALIVSPDREVKGAVRRHRDRSRDPKVHDIVEWTESGELVRPPERVIADYMGPDWELLQQFHDAEVQTPSHRAAIDKFHRADEAMARKLTAALQEHYAKRNSYWPSTEQMKREAAARVEVNNVVYRVMNGQKTFGLKLVKSASSQDGARFGQPTGIPGKTTGPYSYVEIMRLLNRATPDTLPYVERMLDRMIERQTDYEKQARSALERNLVGFNKPDSSTAIKLKKRLEELRRKKGSDAEFIAVHYKMSKLLAKYASRQLLEMMNEGARKHGYSVRVNRSR